MTIIDNCMPAKDGGWIGSIRTLTIGSNVCLVPNDDRHGSNAPTFKAFIGQSRISHAREARSGGEDQKTDLSGKLDGPGLIGPISATLFPSDDGSTAQLMWGRRLLSDPGIKVGRNDEP
jgi:uncharacterized protein (DUF736 family)